jgi:hypothetical protein
MLITKQRGKILSATFVQNRRPNLLLMTLLLMGCILSVSAVDEAVPEGVEQGDAAFMQHEQSSSRP